MILSDIARIDVRRHLNYPPVGTPQIAQGRAGAQYLAGMIDYGTDGAYTHLELRLDRMRPAEESRLTGFAYGSIYLANETIVPGDELNLNFSEGGLLTEEDVTITVLSNETPLAFLERLAVLINQNPVLTAKQFSAFAPTSVDKPTFREVMITCPAAFTMIVTQDGTLGVSQTSFGNLPDPSIQIKSNPLEYIHGYLPICNYLEGAIGGATQNLDTARADVWTGQAREVEKRTGLYNYYCQRMADFLGVSFFPRNNGRNRGNRLSI